MNVQQVINFFFKKGTKWITPPECKKCTNNTYQSKTGQLECLDCEQGKVSGIN